MVLVDSPRRSSAWEPWRQIGQSHSVGLTNGPESAQMGQVFPASDGVRMGPAERLVEDGQSPAVEQPGQRALVPGFVERGQVVARDRHVRMRWPQNLFLDRQCPTVVPQSPHILA